MHYVVGARNTRSLIKLKNIPDDIYIFAKKNNENNWIKTNGKSIKHDKILIKKDYLINIPELNESNDDIKTDDGIQKAPNVIILDDSEKFKDDSGNIIEIETRGTRNCNDIYFKVKDVSIGFEMPSLYKVLIDSRNQYEHIKDYEYFMCKNVGSNEKKK